MTRHLRYLYYIVRHKWFVFVAGVRIGAPLGALILRDWSKFLPSEWTPYVEYFYGRGGAARHAAAGGRYRPGADDAFDVAWLKHQHRNPHHWQHWLLQQDDGELKTLYMPCRFCAEMVADWAGAGRAQGRDDLDAWYEKNKETIRLHPGSRVTVEYLLWEMGRK